MRASIRGSIRSVMLTDSESSAPATRAASMSRRSGRFSAQKAASACSLSNRGTSSQVERVFMAGSRVAEGLVHLALVEEFFLVLERPGVDDPDGLAVGAVDAEDAGASGGSAKVEISGLSGEAGGIGQQLDGEGIFEGLLNVLDGDGAVQIERQVVPIKVHGVMPCISIDDSLYLLCIYKIHIQPRSQSVNRLFFDFVCHAAAPSPQPSPPPRGEGVRWRRWYRNAKHLAVGRLAP